MAVMTRTGASAGRLLLVAALLCLAAIGCARSAGAAELLMFEDRGCPWCERWRREVGVAYANSAEGRQAPLRRIELRQARASGVVLAVPVTLSPTFVLAADGREVGRITGYPGADFFWGMLSELIAKLDRGAAAERQSPNGQQTAPQIRD